MAQIRVINNHTGDEGEVDESWLERWPDDFTPLDQEDPESEPPTSEEPPSDGTTKENN